MTEQNPDLSTKTIDNPSMVNEVKKALYREKPLAIFDKASKSSLIYRCTVKKNEDEDMNIYFDIPISDIGDATFERFMPAQQLIRWLITTITD